MLSAEHVADVQGAAREEEVEEEGDQDADGEQQVEAGEPDHSVLSMFIIVLVIMVIILTMGSLIKLVTVILPADGFGSSNLVATFNPMKTRKIAKLPKKYTRLEHLRHEHGERRDGSSGYEERSCVDSRVGPRRPDVEPDQDRPLT